MSHWMGHKAIRVIEKIRTKLNGIRPQTINCWHVKHTNSSRSIVQIAEFHSILFESHNQLLTCETYEFIKEHSPNVVFGQYKQNNKLQELLSKHHCPQHNKEKRANVGSNLMPTSVVLEGLANNSTVVSMIDWLTNERALLEYRFQFKDNVSGQGSTRKIERECIGLVGRNPCDFWPIMRWSRNEFSFLRLACSGVKTRIYSHTTLLIIICPMYDCAIIDSRW